MGVNWVKISLLLSSQIFEQILCLRMVMLCILSQSVSSFITSLIQLSGTQSNLFQWQLWLAKIRLRRHFLTMPRFGSHGQGQSAADFGWNNSAAGTCQKCFQDLKYLPWNIDCLDEFLVWWTYSDLFWENVCSCSQLVNLLPKSDVDWKRL